VVGHFDLIKLLSADPGHSPKEHEIVWQKIQRNLKFIVQYGGLIEINSSGLKKGRQNHTLEKLSARQIPYQLRFPPMLTEFIGGGSIRRKVHSI
jgi:histidinol phosphatase-like PHP family hydrolase